MELLKLAEAINDEGKAEELLRGYGIIREFKGCIYCGNRGFGKVRRNSYKCYRCKREWGIRKGSILEGFRVKLSKVILAIKLFELEVPVLRASKELKLSYNTVHRLFTVIRERLYKFSSKDDLLKGEVEADESYFGGRKRGKAGRGAGGKIPVFGILERNGKVKVEIVKDVRAETLLKETIKKVKRGSLIYTDRYRSYDGLVSYGFKHKRIDHSKRFTNGKVYINGIEGFWSYAKGKLLKYHGLSKELFPYYLKELEFRYNYRNERLFDKIMEAIRGECI